MSLARDVRELEECLARLRRRQHATIAFLRTVGGSGSRTPAQVAERALELLGERERPFKFPAPQAYYDPHGPGHLGAREDCPRCNGRGVLDVGRATQCPAKFVLCPCVPEVPA